MSHQDASAYSGFDSMAMQSGLKFHNEIPSSSGSSFTFKPLVDQHDDQGLTYKNLLPEDNQEAQSTRQQHDVYYGDLHRDDKFRRLPRTKTGLSSSIESLQTQLNARSRRSPTARFMHDWWLELISCIFLLAALIAIIVTAHEYQGSPLPNLPSGISINSILAIFNVILKAAMLLVLAQGLSHLKWTWFQSSRPLSDLAVYDNASRGPLGSIWLMFRLRGRDIVSSIGALLTLTAVVLDPMAQQVIRYYSCQRVQPYQNGTLPRTNAYMEIGAHAGAGINSVPQALQSAINAGVFVPGAQVNPSCSTGNCTFRDISYTVGMQSVCTDVSEELVFTNVTMNTFQTLHATLPSGLYTSYNVYSANVTLMTMDFNISTGVFELIVGPRVANPQSSDNFCATSTDLDEPLGPNPTWGCRGWGATRCQFSPAIYKISNASVQAGKLNENLELATSLNYTTAGFSANSYSLADLECLSASQLSALKNAGYQIPSSQWLPYNVSMDFQGELVAANSSISNTTRDIVPQQCIYQIYSVTVTSLYYFLGDYLSGSIVPIGSRWTGPTVVQQIFNDYGASYDSVSSVMNNITSSMTTYIRQNGLANNSAPAAGEVWDTDTCIRVRWSYVAFPATLTGMTILFFIAMVIITSRAQQGVHHDFKSSPLALLFHGFDDNTSQRVQVNQAGESNEVGDLREEARDMWVRLRPTDKGWRFVADQPKDLVR